MLGSFKACSNCGSTDFKRVSLNRTIQCATCLLILEERTRNDLLEYHALTQTEQRHCVVTPDFLHTHILDDIPGDPCCTPGFITSFRMLSPLRDPVYAATARTLSGALAEMERIIGDVIYGGYVGYNGRAPGGVVAKEDGIGTGKSTAGKGDGRHTLVAYFVILELGGLLGVDRETINLAVRIFRYTANNVSLRNRSVESLATASFVEAIERRRYEFNEWEKAAGRKEQEGFSTTKGEVINEDGRPDGPQINGPESNQEAKGSIARKKDLRHKPPPPLTLREISEAAQIDEKEVQRSLKVVNNALQKQRPENSTSVPTHMPTFCQRLELPRRTQELALNIAQKALETNQYDRRNPISVSAAAIYLACQLEEVKKTQTEICRVTGLSEVTLRKVYKELHVHVERFVPPGYVIRNKKDILANGSSAGVQRKGAKPGDTALGASQFPSGIERNVQKRLESPSRQPPLRKVAPHPPWELKAEGPKLEQSQDQDSVPKGPGQKSETQHEFQQLPWQVHQFFQMMQAVQNNAMMPDLAKMQNRAMSQGLPQMPQMPQMPAQLPILNPQLMGFLPPPPPPPPPLPIPVMEIGSLKAKGGPEEDGKEPQLKKPNIPESEMIQGVQPNLISSQVAESGGDSPTVARGVKAEGEALPADSSSQPDLKLLPDTAVSQQFESQYDTAPQEPTCLTQTEPETQKDPEVENVKMGSDGTKEATQAQPTQIAQGSQSPNKSASVTPSARPVAPTIPTSFIPSQVTPQTTEQMQQLLQQMRIQHLQQQQEIQKLHCMLALQQQSKQTPESTLKGQAVDPASATPLSALPPSLSNPLMMPMQGSFMMPGLAMAGGINPFSPMGMGVPQVPAAGMRPGDGIPAAPIQGPATTKTPTMGESSKAVKKATDGEAKKEEDVGEKHDSGEESEKIANKEPRNKPKEKT